MAFLIVRDGTEQEEVFRLAPGQVTTVGRAPTNRIVLRDEICSRNHCEIFQDGKQWTLRDLGSRNGTLVEGTRVVGDWELEDGQRIRIGACHLGFTLKPIEAYTPIEESGHLESTTETVELPLDDPDAESKPRIIHRRRNSRYQTDDGASAISRDRTSRELACLYKLAIAMGAARNSKHLADVVLDGLFSGTEADIGAILLLPQGTTSQPEPHQLSVIAYKSTADQPYRKVSSYLSGVVLADWVAILARDIAADTLLASRDSLGEMHAKSVICAPIRTGPIIHGLIHLYTTNPDHGLELDDLEFTLAVADQMSVALDNLKQRESLVDGLERVKDENRTLRRQLAIDTELVGDGPAMKSLKQVIARIAPTDATVLIRGESGVGKELVARALHFGSERKHASFICMNCAALSETLLESELFGHEKGSFTGATGRKLGKFEQADGGTLFLDEVGEMSPSIQAKFLRVLEGHPFERVGGGTTIQVDVRVVAATNRDLEHAVEEKKFRKDLYFRLYVVEITVPPLRERSDDIAVLAKYFLDQFADKTKRPVRGFTDAALAMLEAYTWPGNVRELQNTIERSVILAAGQLITEDEIQVSNLGTNYHAEGSLEKMECVQILNTLELTNWNKSRAAQMLGIDRSSLDRKLKRYKVSRPEG